MSYSEDPPVIDLRGMLTTCKEVGSRSLDNVPTPQKSSASLI